ncbi:MAG: hypothetical protein M3P18_12030 [Actinomycetota bacterium]|nr:hypothetical protein [Actinomycetota bacterium]
MYDATVDVTGQARDGWLALDTVKAGASTVVREVYDQGETWIFRFGYLGHHQELEVSRTDLVRGHWRVTVPASFGSYLKHLGASPPPSR